MRRSHTGGSEQRPAPPSIMAGKPFTTLRISPRKHRRSIWGPLLAAALFGLSSVALHAWAPSEYEVKAAYLYNFAHFVQWPRNAPSASAKTFGICVLGADPFGRVLDDTVAGEMIDGKSVIVRRISQAKDAAGCRIIFIGESEASNLAEVLSSLSSDNALTVSDIALFTDHGGMIGLITEGRHVRFEVNMAAARRADLGLSSQLLKLAVRIVGNPHGDSPAVSRTASKFGPRVVRRRSHGFRG